MHKYFLSIVMAVKEWDEVEVKRLLLSISTQEYSDQIQLIVIYSGNSPEKLMNDLPEVCASVRWIKQNPCGVYNAYMAGISNADGEFVLLSGGDDFFLPGLSHVLKKLQSKHLNMPDLVVCHVLFGNYKLLVPSISKIGLILGNWCQQGVLYRKSIFNDYRLDPKYKIQADHKLHIELLSDSKMKILKCHEVISYFSCGGMSQSQPDIPFWSDMPNIVGRNFGYFYKLLSIARRWLGVIINGHPMSRFKKNEF